MLVNLLNLASYYSSYSSSYPYSSSRSYSSTSSAASTGAAAALAGFAIFMWIIGLVIVILTIVAMWKIFKKAGEAGWKSIIPIYNYVVLCQIVGLNPLLVLLFLLPFPGVLVLNILIAIKLAKAFGKGTGTIIGLILVPQIFYLILGLGKAQYDPSVRAQAQGPQGPQGPQQPPVEPMQ